MEAPPDLLLHFVLSILGAGGVYGAIKANLAATMKSHDRLENKVDEHLRDHAKGAMK